MACQSNSFKMSLLGWTQEMNEYQSINNIMDITIAGPESFIYNVAINKYIVTMTIYSMKNRMTDSTLYIMIIISKSLFEKGLKKRYNQIMFIYKCIVQVSNKSVHVL